MSQESSIPPSKFRDEQTVLLMRHLFGIMLGQEGLAAKDAVSIIPEYFLAWARAGITDGTIGTAELAAEAGVDQLAVDFFQEIINSPGGPLMVSPVWGSVVLAYRGALKHKVASTQLCYLVRWADGRMLPVSLTARPGSDIMDGDAATVLLQQSKEVNRMIYEQGLDALHEEAAVFDEHAYDVLMGAFNLIIPQLKPEYHVMLKQWVCLIQAVVRSPASRLVGKSAVLTPVAPCRDQRGTSDSETESGGFC